MSHSRISLSKCTLSFTSLVLEETVILNWQTSSYIYSKANRRGGEFITCCHSVLNIDCLIWIIYFCVADDPVCSLFIYVILFHFKHVRNKLINNVRWYIFRNKVTWWSTERGVTWPLCCFASVTNTSGFSAYYYYMRSNRMFTGQRCLDPPALHFCTSPVQKGICCFEDILHVNICTIWGTVSILPFPLLLKKIIF